jgi:hypothetical protein
LVLLIPCCGGSGRRDSPAADSRRGRRQHVPADRDKKFCSTYIEPDSRVKARADKYVQHRACRVWQFGAQASTLLD